MASKGLTIQAAICPFCSSTDARLELYSNNGVSDSAHIVCSGCGMKTKNLLDQRFTSEEE